MNVRFAELSTGQTAQLKVRVTERMLDAFAELTGDVNPLHTDAEYAAERGHPARVAHGMLVASFVSKLVGMHLPGRNALLHGVKVEFRRPIYPGEELTLNAEVTHLNEAFKRVEMKLVILNQDGSRVVTGTIQAGVYE